MDKNLILNAIYNQIISGTGLDIPSNLTIKKVTQDFGRFLFII